MYSDLFDQLGGGAGGRRGGGSSNAGPPAVPPLVSFKAGKMLLTSLDEGSPNKYQCQADTKRGEVRLVWSTTGGGGGASTSGHLEWQFYDRREKKVLEKHAVPTPSSTDAAGTFERVEVPDDSSKERQKDRIYVWTRPDGTHDMYWMQDASDEQDDSVVTKVNQYLADPASAAPTPEAMRNILSSSGSGGMTSLTAGSGDAASNNNQSQVDALSSILENLGMPQAEATAAGSSLGSSATNMAGDGGGGETAAAGGGRLTLEDLQGAMAVMQQTQQAQAPVPLSEVVTPAAITDLLLTENQAVRDRLIALLPEEQRSAEYLEENLRSPQVQATLRSLTQALLPDDAGNMDGFYSVLANFQLPAGDDASMAASLNNPVQAFLDAVLASVEKEKAEEEGEETKDGGGVDEGEKQD